MNEFRTVLKTSVSKSTISLKHQILTLGSCFSDVMGAKLLESKFSCLPNPFAAIYNPLSLHKVLSYAITKASIPEYTFIQNRGLHLNYDFHSKFCSPEKAGLKQQLADVIQLTYNFLQKVNWIVLTYGTSWVYNHKETGETVANCHKVPADQFEKRLLTQAEIMNSFEQLVKSVKVFNPAAQIILTVSPVRHVKDTLELNSVSKALLRLTCHYLTEAYEHVHYFPSYEIVLDDLRDYRFYKRDMIHPNEQAEDYIWEKFVEAYMDEATKKFIDEWKSIRAALLHKPFNPHSSGHQNFLKKTINKLEELKSIVNVDDEIRALKAQCLA